MNLQLNFLKQFRFAVPAIAFCFIATSIHAQSNWNLVNVLSTGNDCYQLTKNKTHQRGAAWSDKELNLKKPFQLYFQFNFGSNDNGADGITVVLQKSGAGLNAIGDDGANIGYGSLLTPITPSVDVEFDTYNNGTWLYNDIADDHCAINGDGITSWTLAPAVPILGAGLNVEDNQYHIIEVSWEPVSTTMKVYFDCNQIQTLTYDLIGGIFSGDSIVYYGITSGTGLANNAQYFCELYLNAGQDSTFCPGVPVTLSGATNFSTYSWSPAAGLSCVNCLNPIADPNASTKYVLTASYGCLTATDTVALNIDCMVLPIELSSFTASCGKNSTELKWTTAAEYNNDYFVVERSADARIYQTLGTVEGAGNSSIEHNYSFVDQQPLSGTNYYRLKQVDFGGASTYSNIQSVNCSSEIGLFVYPNPSNDVTHLQIQSSSRTTVECVVSSLSGEIVLNQEVKLADGSNEVLLGNKELASGVYDVAIIVREKVLHSLLVIQ